LIDDGEDAAGVRVHDDDASVPIPQGLDRGSADKRVFAGEAVLGGRFSK